MLYILICYILSSRKCSSAADTVDLPTVAQLTMIRKGSGKNASASFPSQTSASATNRGGDLSSAAAAERLANYGGGADPVSSPPLVTSPADSDPGMATGIGSPGSDMADLTNAMDSLSATGGSGHRDSTFSIKEFNKVRSNCRN